MHVYYIYGVYVTQLRHIHSVSKFNCSCNVLDALYVRKTLAVRPSINSCKYLFKIAVCKYSYNKTLSIGNNGIFVNTKVTNHDVGVH